MGPVNKVAGLLIKHFNILHFTCVLALIDHKMCVFFGFKNLSAILAIIVFDLNLKVEKAKS